MGRGICEWLGVCFCFFDSSAISKKKKKENIYICFFFLRVEGEKTIQTHIIYPSPAFNRKTRWHPKKMGKKSRVKKTYTKSYVKTNTNSTYRYTPSSSYGLGGMRACFVLLFFFDSSPVAAWGWLLGGVMLSNVAFREDGANFFFFPWIYIFSWIIYYYYVISLSILIYNIFICPPQKTKKKNSVHIYNILYFHKNSKNNISKKKKKDDICYAFGEWWTFHDRFKWSKVEVLHIVKVVIISCCST